jgi:hypothetical protein
MAIKGIYSRHSAGRRTVALIRRVRTQKLAS